MLAVLVSWSSGRALSQTAAVDLVNPLVGTAGDGMTFPGVGVPFGMTQWTPVTQVGEGKKVSPYYFQDNRIRGFRGSHFLSGSATQDYGSFQVLAGVGDPGFEEGGPSSSFVHASEQSSPMLYEVALPELGVRASLTGTTRCGLLRFTFSKGGRAWVTLQNNARPGDGVVSVDAGRGELMGENRVRRLYAGQGKLAGFSGYAVADLDRPFRPGGTWAGTTVHRHALRQEAAGSPSGVWVEFDVKAGETVEVRVGTSFTSVEQARQNLRAELPTWNFAKAEAASRQVWEHALGAMEVRGRELDRRIFYTAMYHALQLPRVFSDVSGTYPSFAGGRTIEVAKGFTYYCDFSLWDTFRALHPMLTIIDPKREGEMMHSLVEKGKQGGFLPIFPAWNSYTSEMVGDHAVAAIGDAYLKGIGGFDIRQAYGLMRKNATTLPASQEEYRDGKGRRALPSYLKYGYIPLENHVQDAFHKDEQVSRTLEYAYDDFVAGEVAQKLGKLADAKEFHARAKNYINVIDPDTGFARGRHEDGTWIMPYNPGEAATYITEGLPFQYTFFVPQDVPGLVALEHGSAAFTAKLDELFAKGYYDQSNEPSHHIAYLYDYVGAACQTQKHVHEITIAQYKDQPDGMSGNDDAGQMSAWYLLSALGFYPVTPGIPAYEIGTPHFADATLHLPGGKQFHIVAHGLASDAPYIRSATLNGRPFNRFWLKHDEIVAGGELVFQMSSQPDCAWPHDRSPPN